MDLTNGILNPALLNPALMDHGVLTLGVSQIVIGLLTVGFLACSVLLVLTVLIQRPQGGGLSGAFGAGAGSGETAFGARTGDALTIATISFFVLWLAVAVGLVLVMSAKPAPPGAPAVVSNEEPVAPDTGAQPTTAPAQKTPPVGDADQPAGPAADDSAQGAAPPTDQPPAGEGTGETGDGESSGDDGAGGQA